jgi:hypothetical protein
LFPCAPARIFSAFIPILQSTVPSRPIECWFGFRIDELREFAYLGQDRSELGVSLRGLLMNGYIAFYTVEAIVILRVLDSRMDIEREMSK